MKKSILTFILLIAIAATSFAQYAEIIKIAKSYERQGEYYKAIVTYNAANVAPDKPADNNINERINYCGNQLNKLRTKAENSKKQAIAERKKADKMLVVTNNALAKAEKMQLNVETAMFDKAVKEQKPEWKGFAYYYQWEELNKDGKKILDQIDSLNLSSNALLRLPKEIKYCSSLKHVNLLSNPDIDWNDCFAKIKLTKINSVYVSVNDLSEINNNFWHLITGIEILKNELTEIPQNILQHKQLTYLDLSADYSKINNFTTLPTELFELTNLKYLILNYCQITSLPKEIENLTNLKILDLSTNKLSELPKEIGNLTKLTKLILSDNKLTILPKEIGNLTNLSELNLWKNELINLPNEIGNLTKLIILDLDYNQLENLPANVGKLTNLTKLKLTWNKLTVLPNSIGNLTKLTELHLGYNKLTSLPNNLVKFTNLKLLNLKGNKDINITVICNIFANFPNKIVISSVNIIDKAHSKLYIFIPSQKTLPKEIGNLTNLDYLDYASNAITDLPSEIGKLTNLTYLNLSFSKLTNLPEEIGNQTNLTYLNLEFNKITRLPSSIGNLKNLTYLNLYRNNVTNLPTEIGNLTNLTELFLMNNKLTSLPTSIGNLSNLQKLSLSNNQLTSLPPEIKNLTNLKELYLGGNNFSIEEKQKVKQWLPDCKIEF